MSETAIRLAGVGKMYRIFGSHGARALDAIGIPIPRSRYSEFWALRDVDLELAKGHRLGVLGRNGAGKSTLLKLITGNVEPTEGEIAVNGRVHAMLEIGGGLHPEFTGRENVHAALAYYDLDRAEVQRIDAEIEAFTELGPFLDQPFKSYSQGMQARLGFAIATSVEPEILIVDEVLGVGDAYFFARSTERMRALIDNGASVLLVSHSLDQIVRFCDEAVWLERGRIVMRGPSAEVVKAYERFIRELEDRRVSARNRIRGTARFDGFAREGYTEQITVLLNPGEGAAIDVAEAMLLRDGAVEERVLVGDAQDSDRSQPAFVALSADAWSEPRREGATYFRSAESPADVAFQLWFYYHDSDYVVRLRYRCAQPASVEVVRGRSVDTASAFLSAGEWATVDIPLEGGPFRADTRARGESPETTLSRWPGQLGFKIADVSVQTDEGHERALVTSGRPLSIAVEAVAEADGTYPLVFAALIFQAGGGVVTRHVSTPVELTVSRGDRVRGVLALGPLLLGNGEYLLSVGLYRRLDVRDVEPSEFYDYFDRSFEFRVVGNPPLHNELVRHPGEWVVSNPVRDQELSPESAL